MTGALDGLRDTAQRVVNRLGKTVTMGRESTTFDPSTGQTTTTTTETEVVATPPQDFTKARIEGTLIQSGDTVIQIPAADFTPQADDKVKIDGDWWGIVQLGKVYSGEKIALYVLHLRR